MVVKIGLYVIFRLFVLQFIKLWKQCQKNSKFKFRLYEQTEVEQDIYTTVSFQDLRQLFKEDTKLLEQVKALQGGHKQLTEAELTKYIDIVERRIEDVKRQVCALAVDNLGKTFEGKSFEDCYSRMQTESLQGKENKAKMSGDLHSYYILANPKYS